MQCVGIAKDQNIPTFPKIIYHNGIQIPEKIAPDSIAEFFNVKVKGLVDDTLMDSNVYNGKQKLQSESMFFMDRESIVDCVKSLKIKNSEGFDRLPQKILFDGLDHLIDPLTSLFSKIYYSKEIQTTETHKKMKTSIYRLLDCTMHFNLNINGKKYVYKV